MGYLGCDLEISVDSGFLDLFSPPLYFYQELESGRLSFRSFCLRSQQERRTFILETFEFCGVLVAHEGIFYSILCVSFSLLSAHVNLGLSSRYLSLYLFSEHFFA